jgi:hypothetical protein
MSWEVKEAMYGSGNLKFSMRDGWEPFSTFKANGSLFLMLRRLVEEEEGNPPPTLEACLKRVGMFPDTNPPESVTTFASAIYDWMKEATRVIIQTRLSSDG